MHDLFTHASPRMKERRKEGKKFYEGKGSKVVA